MMMQTIKKMFLIFYREQDGLDGIMSYILGIGIGGFLMLGPVLSFVGYTYYSTIAWIISLFVIVISGGYLLINGPIMKLYKRAKQEVYDENASKDS